MEEDHGHGRCASALGDVTGLTVFDVDAQVDIRHHLDRHADEETGSPAKGVDKEERGYEREKELGHAVHGA